MKLYYQFLLLHLKCAIEYKMSFILLVLGQVLSSFYTFLALIFLFDRFPVIKGYGFGDIILCYAVSLISYTIAEIFGRGFDLFAKMISQGEFDRILLRPRNEIFLVFTGKMELARAGRLLQSIVILCYGMRVSGVNWGVDKLITVLFMIVGGTVLFGCIFMIFASICFFTLESLEIVSVITDGARTFSQYPFDIYGKNILRFCTYVIPYALVQYYPLMYLTGRETNAIYMFIPLAACLVIIPTVYLWKFGLRHYQSTGS